MGKRADPSTSLETARRHLFRHFHDVKELQRNPLCAAFFQAARAQRRPAPDHAAILNLHRTIHKIVDDYERSTMGEPDGEPLRRQLALFKAYIFEQRSWEELAAELGLSRRQFFRDYASVRDRILEGFTQWGPPAHAEQWLESDEIPLSQAALLIEANVRDEAVSRLRSAAHNAARPETRAKALCMLARAAMDDARFSEAEALLHDAAVATDAPGIRGEVAVLNKYLQWYSCGTAAVKSVQPAERAGLGYDRNDPGISSAYLHFLMCESLHMTWLGELAQAYKLIQRAKALLDAEPNSSVEDRVLLLQIYGHTLADLSPQNLPQCANVLTEGLELARKNALARSGLFVSAMLGMCFVASGNASAANTLIERCLTVSSSLNDRPLQVTMSIDLSEPLAVGPQTAHALLTRVLPLLPETHWRLPSVYLNMAVASAELKHAQRALGELEEANRLAGRIYNQRLNGAILRELAAAQFHNGQKRAAKATIDDALSVLERYGGAYSLAKAYRTYASITGDQRYIQKAAAL